MIDWHSLEVLSKRARCHGIASLPQSKTPAQITETLTSSPSLERRTRPLPKRIASLLQGSQGVTWTPTEIARLFIVGSGRKRTVSPYAFWLSKYVNSKVFKVFTFFIFQSHCYRYVRIVRHCTAMNPFFRVRKGRNWNFHVKYYLLMPTWLLFKCSTN